MCFNVFLLKEKPEKVAAIQWESSCNIVWEASLIPERPKEQVCRTVVRSSTVMDIPLEQRPWLFQCWCRLQHVCFSCSSWNKGCERYSHCHIPLESCLKDRQSCSCTSIHTLFSFMPKIIAEGSTSIFFSYDINKMFYFLKLMHHPRWLSLFKSLLILIKPLSPDLMPNDPTVPVSRFPNCDITNP